MIEPNITQNRGVRKFFAASKTVARKRADAVRKVKNSLLVSAITIGFALSGCRDSPRIVRVDLIDRAAVAAPGQKPDPRLLVVGIDENGRLSLNRIETGTVADFAELNEKLRVVFDDREKAGSGERGVVVDPQGNVKNEELEKLIENLANVKAMPIRVIKDGAERFYFRKN